MNQWLKSLIGFMLITSIAQRMLPNSEYERYLRIFTGFLMLILLLHPLWQIGSLESYVEEHMDHFLKEQERLETSVENLSGWLEETSVEEIQIEDIETIRVEVGEDE